jgi:hypothetical protein
MLHRIFPDCARSRLKSPGLVDAVSFAPKPVVVTRSLRSSATVAQPPVERIDVFMHCSQPVEAEMKHDAWLRDAAREFYYANYLEADADFLKAERERHPVYLAAVDAAYEARAAGWEWRAQERQLPLL